VHNNPLNLVDPTGMFGEYFDGNGNHLGSDGKNDGKVYLANKRKSGKIKDLLKEGGADNIKKAKANSTELPGVKVLEESLDVLDRTDANGGYREESSLVMDDGSIVQGKTGPMPVIENGRMKVYTNPPDIPAGYSASNVTANIHSHPNKDFPDPDGGSYPSSAYGLSNLDIDGFKNYQTNIVTGPLGQSAQSSKLGIAVYNKNATLRVTISRSAASKIVDKLKNK
jgi:hypothetical protein